MISPLLLVLGFLSWSFFGASKYAGWLRAVKRRPDIKVGFTEFLRDKNIARTKAAKRKALMNEHCPPKIKNDRIRKFINHRGNVVQHKVIQEIPFFHAHCGVCVAELIKLQKLLPEKDRIVDTESFVAAWNELE